VLAAHGRRRAVGTAALASRKQLCCALDEQLVLTQIDQPQRRRLRRVRFALSATRS
jgi:hypothetical protein